MSASPPDDPVEALIRDHLARLESAVDPDRLLARVRSGMKTPAAGSPRRTRRPGRRIGWSMVVAAGILGLFVSWAWFPSKVPLRAAEVVRAARDELAKVEDRHYRSNARPRPEALALHPNLAQVEGFHSDLWTRGDRSRVHSEGIGPAFDWGRDEKGRTWVVPNDGVGLIFEPGEVPESLVVASDLLSLRPDHLLDEMLSGFDLSHESPDPDDGPDVVRIRAVPRPGHATPRLLAATLDVDTRSRVIRRLTLTRGTRGRAMVDVTFTLVDTEPQSEADYAIEGHLRDHANIFGNDRPLRRRQLLIRHLGHLTRTLAELRGSQIDE